MVSLKEKPWSKKELQTLHARALELAGRSSGDWTLAYQEVVEGLRHLLALMDRNDAQTPCTCGHTRAEHTVLRRCTFIECECKGFVGPNDEVPEAKDA